MPQDDEGIQGSNNPDGKNTTTKTLNHPNCQSHRRVRKNSVIYQTGSSANQKEDTTPSTVNKDISENI